MSGESFYKPTLDLKFPLRYTFCGDDKMLEIAKRINLSPLLLEKLAHIEKVKIQSLADKCMSDGFFVLKRCNDIIRLAVMLELAVRVKQRYDAVGIDEKIYYDTMSDIRIWCEENGNRGLKNYGWIKNHVSFELFRLGRLQFQLYECKNRTLLYNKLPFAYGEKLVYIHIPAGERLDTEQCKASLEASKKFFSQFFPDYSYRYYFCESWLLFENNRDFMSQDSNIVSFMSLFDICYSVKVDKQAIERIFKKRCLFKRNYPENTSLQLAAKKYMQGGNRLGIGIGVIAK